MSNKQIESSMLKLPFFFFPFLGAGIPAEEQDCRAK